MKLKSGIRHSQGNLTLSSSREGICVAMLNKKEVRQSSLTGYQGGQSSERNKAGIERRHVVVEQQWEDGYEVPRFCHQSFFIESTNTLRSGQADAHSGVSTRPFAMAPRGMLSRAGPIGFHAAFLFLGVLPV